MKKLVACLALLTASAVLADTTTDYDVVITGKKVGSQKVIVRSDGRIHVSYTYRDNGRGPDSEEEIALLPEGTFKRYRQTGRNTYGAALDESYSLSGRRGSWHSPADQGSQELPGPALYLPTYGSPESSALIVSATQMAGGHLPALPGGELRSEKLAQSRVGRAGRDRDVALYAIFGLDLQPEYIWMELSEPMRFFASIVVGGTHVIAAGYDDVSAELERVQQEARTRYVAGIASRGHACSTAAYPHTERSCL